MYIDSDSRLYKHVKESILSAHYDKLHTCLGTLYSGLMGYSNVQNVAVCIALTLTHLYPPPPPDRS
jgi:hypothetical protein